MSPSIKKYVVVATDIFGAVSKSPVDTATQAEALLAELLALESIDAATVVQNF